ncbi:MAG TPA: Uma2 family endonuclease [Chloroflexota bacterium]|nr:Uma2 family endonuclease [Chloroflexota bacterium]
MAEPQTKRWTVADLEALPYDEMNRYEIIDGELFVSRQPRDEHQDISTEIIIALGNWNHQTRLGFVLHTPGVIFSDNDAVAPDVVWLSRERRAAIEQDDGHLHGAPELMVEILSPGAANERRDRERKLRQYSVYGVEEYWIVDPPAQAVAVYRRQDARLRLVATLQRDDTLTSPLLPGFSLAIARLFER